MPTFWVFYKQGPAVQFEAESAAEAAERYADMYQPLGLLHVAAETAVFHRNVTVSEAQA